jgi:peroxiredoxin
MKKYVFTISLVALTALFTPAAKAQFAANAIDVNPLKTGQEAPDITLINGNGASNSLHAVIGDKPTLILFYRGDWCSNCINHFSTEIVPNLERINALGYNVMLIGPDDAEHIRATASKINASPAIIWSDAAGDLSVAMGVAWQQPERALERLAEYSGGKNKGFVPVISTFVVGADKRILFADIRPNGTPAANRIKGKLLMAILENLQ